MEYRCQAFPEVLTLCSLGLNEGLSPHPFLAAGTLLLRNKVMFGRANLTWATVRFLSPRSSLAGEQPPGSSCLRACSDPSTPLPRTKWHGTNMAGIGLGFRMVSVLVMVHSSCSNDQPFHFLSWSAQVTADKIR